MPFTVQDLIEDKPDPVTINRSDSTQTALELMIKRDFSQLPVVDNNKKVKGIITSDSIIRALDHFDITIKEMRVLNAMNESINTFRPEDNLFDLLDYLKNEYAAIVVDNDDRVVGIITNYDTTEYFRRRGEDIMLVEDIETMLKDYVILAFQDEAGQTDDSALETAIVEITPSNIKFRKPFENALCDYLTAQGVVSQPDQNKINEVFTQHINPKPTPKPFDRLTMNEYIEMFLHKNRWDQYKSVIELEAKSCRKLLDAVREIRNALAHFRADLTSQQRDQLRFCKDWLTRIQQDITESFSSKFIDESRSLITEPVEESKYTPTEVEFLNNLKKQLRGQEAVRNDIPPQFIEESSSNESRYAELAKSLQNIPYKIDSVQLAFEEIENLINGQLPRTARQHRSWWANDSVSHIQSRQWLEVGWRVSNVNISQERVTFSRIKGREQAYITFFSNLLTDLREKNTFEIKVLSPSGRAYITIDNIINRENSNLTFLGFSFARGARFRVELYIDSGNQEKNKAIFDALYSEKELIENVIEMPLNWESLDDRRASRIAAYHSGSITDSEIDLSLLRKWAVETMSRFYYIFHDELRGKILQQDNRSF